jgi:hypothetical protein
MLQLQTPHDITPSMTPRACLPARPLLVCFRSPIEARGTLYRGRFARSNFVFACAPPSRTLPKHQLIRRTLPSGRQQTIERP